MAASMSVGTVKPSVSLAGGQRVARASRSVCHASKREDTGRSPILSTVLAGAVAGALCFADVGSAFAQEQDIYEKLGIERPAPGSSGVVLKSKDKKTVFQSSKPVAKSAPAPAPAPTPPPPPPPPPAPVESTVKPAAKKPKVSKSKVKAAAEKKEQAPTKAAAESSKPSPPAAAPGVSSKAAAGAAAAGAAAAGAAAAGAAAASAGAAGATAGGFSLPSFELPSVQAPSLSAPSISVGGGANDIQQAAIVAGAEIVLLAIVNSIVGGLFSKKPRKA